MLLFFRMLPESVTSADLRRHVQRAARPGWLARFLGSANILGCQILRLQAPSGSRIEHHGLVRVEPQRTALAVIRKLNGTHWKGTTLRVRKYHHRRADRDRRGQQPMVQQLAI